MAREVGDKRNRTGWGPEKKARFEKYMKEQQEEEELLAMASAQTRVRRGSDPQVVSGRRMAELLTEFEKRWRAAHPQRDQISPWRWLGWEVGIDDDVIRKIAAGQRQTVQLPLAEKLLIAIGQHWRLGTGNIKIMKNPSWSLERYEAWRREQGCF